MFTFNLRHLLFAIMVTGLMIWASPTPAQDKERGASSTDGKELLSGVLKRVDADTKTVLVHLRGDPENIHQSYRLATDVRVSISEKPGRLADLKAGMSVHIKLSNDQKEIVALSAVPGRGGEGERPVRGVLKSLEANKITVTILRDGEAPEDKTLTLAKTVRISVGEREAKLADLKPGMRVEARLSDDQKEAIAVVATPLRRAGAGAREPDRSAVRALLKEIKGDKIIVTIPRDGGRVEEKEFALAKKVRVSTQTKEAGELGDLRAGSSILLTLSGDRREVVAIREVGRRGDN